MSPAAVCLVGLEVSLSYCCFIDVEYLFGPSGGGHFFRVSKQVVGLLATVMFERLNVWPSARATPTRTV